MSRQAERTRGEIRLLNVRDILPSKLLGWRRDRTFLASSVKRHGILQNIAVRPHPKRKGKFELIFGVGRWQEAKKTGKRQVWALIRECSDQELLVLAGQENLARTSLSPIEEGELLKKLRDMGYTTRQLAHEFNMSVGQVVERIKLVEILPDQAKKAIGRGTVAPSTFEFVRSSVKDPQMQAQVFAAVVEKRLDLDSTLQFVRGIKATSDVYADAKEFQSDSVRRTPSEKPRVQDITCTLEVELAEVIRGSDGSLLVRDVRSHRDRNLLEEFHSAWLKVREGDRVQLSFHHTQQLQPQHVKDAAEEPEHENSHNTSGHLKKG